jgi:RNA polymerase sigma factor (sigma-70 family)
MRHSDSSNWVSKGRREEFWESAVNGLRPRLRRYIAKSACTADESDDMVADVIEDLVSREAAFASCSNHWEFVLPILRRRCAEAKRRWRQEIATKGQFVLSAEPPDWEERERYLDCIATWLRAAMQKLPPKQREALRLRFLEGRAYSEIAALMQTSQNSARFNIHAALRRLHELEPPNSPAESSNKRTAKRP